jgi:hypothetical protein
MNKPKPRSRMIYDSVELSHWLRSKNIENPMRILFPETHQDSLEMLSLSDILESAAVDDDDFYDKDFIKVCKILKDELNEDEITVHVWW